MPHEEKKLEIGDVIFMDSHYHGLSKATVDRVTKTRAFCGKDGFNRSYRVGCYIIPYPRETGWNRPWYELSSDELEKKFTLQKALATIRKIKWDEHNIETLNEVLKITGDSK